ncbi:hypothetical protein Taro_009674 [Colocasia esculenta]|uniref:Uncharacterized protein n=1 Tax=Colocasia esculenta TaxID=4460 RepID=A0A843U0V2_COLES|nr:hypothetical protein [Colocasia esculenta]
MGLRPCGLQVVVFSWSPQLLDPFHVEQQLDLSSVAARLRGRPMLACPSQSLVSRTSSRGSCVVVSTLARTLVLLYLLYLECVVSLARLRPVRGRRTRIEYVIGLTGLDEAFRHSWYQIKVRAAVMADRRDWGGRGDDPEESTQRMIERIWESLTEIRMRMDQQAPVPPVTGEAVPVAPVPPPPGVEVPFVALVPPITITTRDCGRRASGAN